MADSSCSRTGVWASTTEDGEDAQSVEANSESADSMKTGSSIKRGKSRPESGRGPARAKRKIEQTDFRTENDHKRIDYNEALKPRQSWNLIHVSSGV